MLTHTGREVVTRFAPSPTGFLHIGGARTALFNWLFARHNGGKFLLRIEDTDRKRYTPEAVDAIYDALKWLGLDWDGEPISQFTRVERHREVAEDMLARGTAYRCYSTKDEIDAFREKAQAEGKPPLFHSPWRDSDATPHEGAEYVIRLKAPREGETVIEDAVQGTVTWKNETLDDLILLRSDGTPTYMLAVVVDDHDMGVTHVIRGDDHLTNAARQKLIYDGNGWEVPVFAHIPLIHGPDGAKFSKRHGAPGVEDYRAIGYPPEAMRNYLVRLGWSHGDDEFFTTEQAIDWFDLDAVGRSPARFDVKKLEALSGQHIRTMDDEKLVSEVEAYVALQNMPSLSAEQRATMLAAMPGLKERAKTLAELVDMANYFLGARPFEPDEKAAEQLDTVSRGMLKRLTTHLQNASWAPDELEAQVRAFSEIEGLKLGKVAQPLRAALTGRTISPSVFDVMATIGKDETLLRLEDATKDAA
jgi:glutamyl-tRNA synthetase